MLTTLRSGDEKQMSDNKLMGLTAIALVVLGAFVIGIEAGLGLGFIEVGTFGLIVTWGIAIAYGMKGHEERMSLYREMGRIASERGEIMPTVAEIMRDYPYQNVVYGTAASEVMNLRNEERERER